MCADVLDPKIYPEAKFISEFGFQSWPSWPAYKQVTGPGDWSLFSPMSKYRCNAASHLHCCVMSADVSGGICSIGTACMLAAAWFHVSLTRCMGLNPHGRPGLCPGQSLLCCLCIVPIECLGCEEREFESSFGEWFF